MPSHDADTVLRIAARTNNKCYYCGQTPSRLTLDHKTPRSRGGRATDDNLVLACDHCNYLKGSRTVDEFRTYLAHRVTLLVVKATRHASLCRDLYCHAGTKQGIQWAAVQVALSKADVGIQGCTLTFYGESLETE